MFEFRLYEYDLNFNPVLDEEQKHINIDLFPALLNEDISLTIERERGVFEKTNSDLSLSFSNFVKLSNGLTIFKYLKDKIAISKFRIKVSKDNQIVFDGYVENESISYDVENETLELNVFAIEKEFWKRCEQIKFSEVNLYMANSVANIPYHPLFQFFSPYPWNLNYVIENLSIIIEQNEYFKDIFTILILNANNEIKTRKIVLRDNKYKTGFYWLDRDKLNLKEFFEAIIKIYNLEFKIDYNLKQGIFQNRLVTTGTTTDISKDIIKSGIIYSPQIEKFDLIKVNDEADINNVDLLEFSGEHGIDTEMFHDGSGDDNYTHPTEQVGFIDEFKTYYGITDNIGMHFVNNIYYDETIFKLYLYLETSDGKKYISNKALSETTLNIPNYTIPIITDIVNVNKRIIRITGGKLSVKYRKKENGQEVGEYIKKTVYPIYQIISKNDINFPQISIRVEGATGDAIYGNESNTGGSALRYRIIYFLSEDLRNSYLFDGYETLKDSSYLDINNNLITNETQIKRSNIFELENEIKLKFHEDKNNDGILNTDEDKPKEATRIQIQRMFGLDNNFYQNLISSFKNILKSTSKIECEVNRSDLKIGDKVTIKYDDKIDGDFIVNKNEIDLVNGISKIEALSEII